MFIYHVSIESFNECFEDMDSTSEYSFTAPSLKDAELWIYFNELEDGNSWSCEHSYFTLNPIPQDQPLDDHDTWDEILNTNGCSYPGFKSFYKSMKDNPAP